MFLDFFGFEILNCCQFSNLKFFSLELIGALMACLYFWSLFYLTAYLGKTKLIFLSLGKAAKKKKKILVVFIGLLRFIPYFFSKAEENKKSSWPKFCKVIIIIFYLPWSRNFVKAKHANITRFPIAL